MNGIANPQLEEMRGRLCERLEAEFALTVKEPEAIPVPGNQGSVLGQVQASDGAGGIIAFYLRPEDATPLVPAYVSRLSRATYEAQVSVRICVVVGRQDDGAERDARACGAGLLLLTAESLTQVVEPLPPTDELNESEFEELVADVRRQITRAAQLRIRELERNYHRAREVVDRNNNEARALLRDIKTKCTRCERWQEKLVKDCDNSARRNDRVALEALMQQALDDEPDA